MMSGNHLSETCKLTAPLSSTSKPATSVSKQENADGESTARPNKPSKRQYHLNSIWSLWYCVLVLVFTCYLIYIGIKRFLLYHSLPWPKEPYIELNAHVGLVGAAVVVTPFFLLASLLKIGNLPNDGFKLGSSLSACSTDPPSVLQPTSGFIRNLWVHGVPTSAFLHLIAAFCLLLPQTLMGAALIKATLLPSSEIWKSDLNVFAFETANTSFSQSRPPSGNSSVALLGKQVGDDVMMIRIRGDEKAPVESRPFSEIAGHLSWRSKRLAAPSYPNSNILPLNLPGPVSEPLRIMNHKGPPPAMPSDAPDGPIKNTQSLSPGDGKQKARRKRPLRLIVSHELEQLKWKPLAPELVNYAFALLVLAIRYPAVFWNTNKRFSILFSIYLFLTGIAMIVITETFSILYKYQISVSSYTSNEERSFVTSPVSSLLLFVMSHVTMTASSSAVYFYGYQRFAAFLHRSKSRFHITYSEMPLVMRPHTAQLSAIAAFLCLALSLGPLMWDFCILYKLSEGRNIVLTAVLVIVGYFCLWIGLWLFFSAKSFWVFKLRVTVARAFVSSARSIKLVSDVEMSQSNHDGSLSPILIVGCGRAVAIKDEAPTREILGVVNRVREEKKLRGAEEEIYWLRPALDSRFHEEDKLRSQNANVTFQDCVEETKKTRKFSFEHCPSDDEYDDGGDYAILKSSYQSFVRKDAFESDRSSSRTSEPNPTAGDPRYVDRMQILAYQKEAKSCSSADSSPVLVAPDYDETDHFDEKYRMPRRYQLLMDAQGCITPRSTRSNDSGIPVEPLSHRSDSASSQSSTPPENSDESGLLFEAFHAPTDSNEDVHHLSQDWEECDRLISSTLAASISAVESAANYGEDGRIGHGIRLLAQPTSSARRTVSLASSDLSSLTPAPVPLLHPLPSLQETGVVGLFPPKHIQTFPGHARINLQDPENEMRLRTEQAHLQYPQMLLNAAPRVQPNSPAEHRHYVSGEMRPQGPPSLSGESQFGQETHRYIRCAAVNQSSSLRYPSNKGSVNRPLTNTMPHLLPKDSLYNTNV